MEDRSDDANIPQSFLQTRENVPCFNDLPSPSLVPSDLVVFGGRQALFHLRDVVADKFFDPKGLRWIAIDDRQTDGILR